MPLWERQPGEKARAYEAAKLYFELGAARSLAAVGQKLGKSKALMERWSVRWNWTERAAAYDRHIDRLEQEARLRTLATEAERWAQRQTEQREQEWQTSRALLERARQMLAHPLYETVEQDGRTIVKPVRWSLRDVAAFLELFSKLGRRAAEMEEASYQVNRTVQKELDLVLDRLKGKLPEDLFWQVLSVIADEPEEGAS
jgi:hypothetical protein